MTTPVFDHLYDMYDRVYEPSEDTFLLLDALESEMEAIRATHPGVCVEIGAGNGVPITFLGMQLKDSADSTEFHATDVNPHAIDAIKQTAISNDVNINVVQCDLLSGLPPELLDHGIDVLIFNPPYVVTPSAEVGTPDLSAAWAGGLAGREVTDRLLPIVPDVLSDSGRFYLVAIKENLLLDTADDLTRSLPGFQCHTVMTRKSGTEHLSILCFTKQIVQ
eukprot:m.27524 g.27524  ORF g.27524 m.27524 type:complete len:220 (-) comp8936_c0_seq1:2346-3005(-)